MKIKRGIVAQKLGNIFVAYDNDAGVLFEFNEVGFEIFRKLEKGKKKRETVKSLTNKFSVSPKEAARDYELFIKDLAKRGLIKDRK